MRSAPPVLLLLPLLLAACSESPPLPEPDVELVLIYCDLAMLAGDAGPTPPDSLRARVFERHGTTQEDYEAALQPYHEDPRRWVLFFKAVSDTLERRTGRRPPPPPIQRPPPDGG